MEPAESGAAVGMVAGEKSQAAIDIEYPDRVTFTSEADAKKAGYRKAGDCW